MTFPKIILHYLVMILSKQKWHNTLLLPSHCTSCPLPTPRLLPSSSSQTAVTGSSILLKRDREPLLLHHREAGHGEPL